MRVNKKINSYFCAPNIFYLHFIVMQSHNSDISKIMEEVTRFTHERDWDQFHNGKDLALALSIEAAELNEAFLWKNPEDVKVEKIREELADIFTYAFLMADKYDLDIKEIILSKLALNAQKYPVEKARGNARKYTEL